VLGVNFIVWPISAESELRRTLVSSLEHISTLGHLLAKTYTMSITEDEKAVRDGLAQSLRVCSNPHLNRFRPLTLQQTDFGSLTQRIQETLIEINWSEYSMTDYSGATRLTIRFRAPKTIAFFFSFFFFVGSEFVLRTRALQLVHIFLRIFTLAF
jgi:hypothetical protein